MEARLARRGCEGAVLLVIGRGRREAGRWRGCDEGKAPEREERRFTSVGEAECVLSSLKEGQGNGESVKHTVKALHEVLVLLGHQLLEGLASAVRAIRITRMVSWRSCSLEKVGEARIVAKSGRDCEAEPR